MFKAFMEGFKQGYERQINEYKSSYEYQAKKEMRDNEMQMAKNEFNKAWGEFKAMNKRIANELKEEWNK